MTRIAHPDPYIVAEPHPEPDKSWIVLAVAVDCLAMVRTSIGMDVMLNFTTEAFGLRHGRRLA